MAKSSQASRTRIQVGFGRVVRLGRLRGNGGRLPGDRTTGRLPERPLPKARKGLFE
jgi:hypothetical protein